MKNFLITGAVVAAIAFSACNANSDNASDSSASADTSVMQPTATGAEMKNTGAPLTDVTAAYLQIKNGLTNDNAGDAAAGGKAFNEALAKVDKTSLTAEQTKSFADAADDAKEMAEHISTNAGKIDHQREHFDMLSEDMYDMVKAAGTGQTLYKDFCPMYNNNKGATWLSETKEINNPYLGKKMPDCGSVKEEIKQ